MTIATINASEEHSQYIGQVYQKHYARLRHYFLTQLNSASEADDCVQETFRRFFFFMEDRCWEADAKYIHIYLMRIAGLLCSRKLSETRAPHATKADNSRRNSLFNKVRAEAAGVMKERGEFIRSILRPRQENNRQSLFSETRCLFGQEVGRRKVV
jgi:DNA-directed RNA polymerase specialized sigma24 family protein